MANTLKHIALIPDGNRRWAKSKGLPVLAGHREVVEKTFPELVAKALELNIKYFTIWGFSTENWNRDNQEVDGLFKIFDLFFEKHGQKLLADGVRISFIGNLDTLDESFRQKISRWLNLTEANDKMILTIAFNYGGRDDIVRGINKVLANQELTEVGESNFPDYLDTSILDIPDPDLIIRPGGEQRLSGFMSWQSAYSELYFDEKLMPDWHAADLQKAVDEFNSRQRRFGK